MNKPKKKWKALTDYWFDNYVNDGHCSLCGNSGVIDTQKTKTAVGIEVGRKNWCICPNGQLLRHNYHPRLPTEVLK